MSVITLDHGGAAAADSAAAVLDDLTAGLFDLDLRAVPVPDITAANTTTDCTDNGCSKTCPSVGCSKGCRSGCDD
ncbi:hypothetical protein [Rhizohabitans arisaemae]|uniref:hypothetical protein n=1 Tax=Rhizohabitans arisaemae TaxID=2720610 RepID=UPI0024B1BC37|nr:hypothetical protein [Rhizohabitans arisaemae]